MVVARTITRKKYYYQRRLRENFREITKNLKSINNPALLNKHFPFRVEGMNFNETTLLTLAVRVTPIEISRQIVANLLEKGADPRIQESSAYTDRDPTPLMLVKDTNSDPELIKLLENALKKLEKI